MTNALEKVIKQKNATILSIGPMSKTCIDAAASISRRYDVPLQLIASRRQIDCKSFGGGYVENMTTESFASYVKSLNAPKVFLARDHGGPWQGPAETTNNLDEQQSMKSALQSFEADIAAGFDYIHIDPSIAIQNETLTSEKIIERLLELYAGCHELAQKYNRAGQISYELGTEEQSGYGSDLTQMEDFILNAKNFCTKNKVPLPSFLVVQTGTKVMETQNIGIFGTTGETLTTDFLNYIKDTVTLCEKHDIALKEHNADYLSDSALALRPVLGIHASNVAPEFGVTETRALLCALTVAGMTKERETFLKTAYNSKKWDKWMLPDTHKTDEDRAIIAGHYIFAKPEIIAIREKLAHTCPWLQNYVQKQVEQSMLRYMTLFNLI